ncbi:RHS repeat domain-containing protein, partial [Pseudomonas putida]
MSLIATHLVYRRTADQAHRSARGEWRYSYDDIGRLIETRDPLGRSEHIKYLRHWALPIQVTDTAGRTRQYGYDSHGNLLWQQDPLGRETQYQ